jgi:tight adherence protein B
MDHRMLLIALLAAGAAVGVPFYIFVLPILTGESQRTKRWNQFVVKGSGKRGADARVVDAAARRKAIADSLKELDATNSKKKKKLDLETRILRAGLTITKQNFFIFQGVGAVVAALLLFGMSRNPYYAAPGLVIGGLGIPNFFLTFSTNRRLKKFALEFPNSIDIIIRGIRAGLPLGDCLRIIAMESNEPVRSEFRQIVEALGLGLSVTEAVERMPDRIPTAEANFFAIVISIQQKAGGNLAEALSNLARVLRERKKMRDKVRAISSEAKASAGIIGALPIVVALLVYFTSPHYIELLWLTDTGRIVLAGCGIVMAIGTFIMQKMIAFDI